MYLLSIVIGLLSGLVAVVIKSSVHLVESVLRNMDKSVEDYLYFIYPSVGILIVILILKFVLKGKIEPGIPNLLYAISKGNGNMGIKGTFSTILTAAITVGFGGSVGLEGPTAATSGALSSNIGQLLRLDYRKKKMLIGAAASGALAAIFNAPIAAIVFALEVIMLDLSVASLIPLLLASASATLMSKLYFNNDFLFHFNEIEPYFFSDIIFYVILGLLTGFISVQFTNTYFFIERLFNKIKGDYTKPIIGGVLVGIMIFIFPQLYLSLIHI